MIDRIEKRLEQLGITKQHLAKKAGMSPSQLSHVLSGDRDFKPEQETIVRNYLGL
jgi:transcriptional regulator with XRE-family HTH domain